MTVNLSKIANFSTKLNNPNSPLPLNTALIEVPSDLAKGYMGYKRGGAIEGLEKLRKELLSAVVWLCGIPAFRKIGNIFCEKVLNVPVDIAYSNSKEGNAAIENSIKFLTTGIKEGNFKDTTELEKKYFKNGVSKFFGQNTEELIKKTKASKIAISTAAVVLNCIAMGIILPLVNQKMTQRELEKIKKQKERENTNSAISMPSFDEFKNNTKKDNSIAFKGALETLGAGSDIFVDLVENSSRFRLIAPDVPMIAGRMATSRNKFEGLEYLVTDGLGIYFYNFCSQNVQNLLQKAAGAEDIDAVLTETIVAKGENSLKSAIEALDSQKDTYQEVQRELRENNSVIKNIMENFKGKFSSKSISKEEKLPQAYFMLNSLFNKDEAQSIYKQATNGAYGKMNEYVKNQKINAIDDSIVKFLTRIKKEAATLDENGQIKSLDMGKITSFVSKNNKKNLAFQLLGILSSIIGLGIFAPKLSYFITKTLTGKNEFIALSDVEEKK